MGAIVEISRTIEGDQPDFRQHRRECRATGAATNEIAMNVQEATAGTQDVSRNIAGVSEAARTTGGVALRIRQDAEALQNEESGYGRRSSPSSRDPRSELTASSRANGPTRRKSEWRAWGAPFARLLKSPGF
ncbi:MAG: hypothetical protein HPM95_19995 [Alphaproteobacteria bacterium]|nr:hypothetical protein [Alphaproteobacteria bacterium]